MEALFLFLVFYLIDAFLLVKLNLSFYSRISSNLISNLDSSTSSPSSLFLRSFTFSSSYVAETIYFWMSMSDDLPSISSTFVMLMFIEIWSIMPETSVFRESTLS